MLKITMTNTDTGRIMESTGSLNLNVVSIFLQKISRYDIYIQIYILPQLACLFSCTSQCKPANVHGGENDYGLRDSLEGSL